MYHFKTTTLLPKMLRLMLVAWVGVLATFFATGMVLCVCDDGHFSIEAECNPLRCCPDASLNGTPGPTQFRSCESHECLDLVVEATSLQANNHRGDDALLLPAPELHAALPLVEKITPERSILSDFSSHVLRPEVAYPALTVVLTI